MPLNIDLGTQPVYTIDENNVPPDNAVELGLAANGTLIVDGVNINIENIIGGGILSDTTIQAVNGANVTLGSAGLGIGAGSSFTYDIGASSMISVENGLIDLGLLNNTTINFDETGGTGQFNFDPGTISLNISTPPTITGLSNGDKISVLGATNASLNGSVLTFTYPGLLGIPQTVSFSLQGIHTGATIAFDSATGTVTYACFLRGTRIATPDGEIAVEDLQPGQLVLTLKGGPSVVRWVGRRLLDPASLARPSDALPVRVKANAIAPNQPHRDLLVSPDHCLLFDDVLIPAKLLVNGTTIVQEQMSEPFEYFHIELDRHDVVIAEGAYAETYLDLGNREMFAEPGVVQLFPSRKIRDWSEYSYPPTYAGPMLEAARDRLKNRAAELGYAIETAMAS